MESILTSLFPGVMLIISTLVMVTTSLFSLSKISDSFQSLQQQAATFQRSALSVTLNQLLTDSVELDVQNAGEVNLDDWPHWSVLLELQGGGITYLTQGTNPPAPGQWALDGIYLPNDTQEVFDPGILNPGEHAHVFVNLGTRMEIGMTARVTIVTATGVSAQCQFTRTA
jgi:hypothetical protein